MQTALLWFRDDLRLADNPALQAALRSGHAIVPVYIPAPGQEGHWTPGEASNAWRHRALQALDANLRKRGSRLRLFAGPTLPILQALVASTGAEAVFWNRRYEPAIEQRDATIKHALRKEGVHAESHNGALLFEPWQVATKQGGPYKVFTPFWRAGSAILHLPMPHDAPAALPDVDDGPHGLPLDALKLSPSPDWDNGFW